MPVPRTTLFSGSSAICTGSLIFWLSLLSRPAQQGTATCEVQTAAVNIGSQFGRCGFQRFQNGFFYFKNAFIQCFRYFLVAHHNLFWNTGYQGRAHLPVNRPVVLPGLSWQRQSVF